MKKWIKYLWIVPIFLVTLIVGSLFFPSNNKNSDTERFQEFSNSYIQLIQNQDPLENYKEIKLDLNNDLS